MPSSVCQFVRTFYKMAFVADLNKAIATLRSYLEFLALNPDAWATFQNRIVFICK
jgi:hypothetical protein